MEQKARNLEHLLDALKASGGEEAVSVGAIVERLSHRSLGALIALLGLIVLMPLIGDIPGAAIICATVALAAIGDSLLGRRYLWLPRSVARQEIARGRLERGIEAARPWVRRVDRLLKPRLRVLVATRPARLMAALAAALLALSLYPLAFIPFGANLPGAGLIAFGLALMVGDGLLVLLGYALVGAALYALVAALW